MNSKSLNPHAAHAVAATPIELVLQPPNTSLAGAEDAVDPPAWSLAPGPLARRTERCRSPAWLDVFITSW